MDPVEAPATPPPAPPPAAPPAATPPAAAPAQSAQMVPFLDPSGTPRMIPADQAGAAASAGGKPAVKIIDPTGTPRWIPTDQQQQALAAGGKLADAQPQGNTEGMYTMHVGGDRTKLKAIPYSQVPVALHQGSDFALGEGDRFLADHNAEQQQLEKLPLTQNPKGEGTYKMLDSKGTATMVPYSRVHLAEQQGYKLDGEGFFTRTGDAARYGKDISADPVGLYGIKQLVDATTMHPVENAKGAAKSAVQVPNTLAGWADSLAAKVLPGDKTSSAGLNDVVAGKPGKPQGPTHIRATLEKAENAVAPGITNENSNDEQSIGGLAEQLSEWMYGEGELKTLTKSEQLAKLSKAAKIIEENPRIARMVASSAGSATQTALHGGDTGQVEQAAAVGGAVPAVMDGLPWATKKILERLARPSITADAVNQAGREIVGEQAARTNATRTNPGNALPSSTGEFQFRIQGTPTEESTVGLRAGSPISDADEGAPLLVDARKKQIGTVALPGKGPATGTMPHDANLADYGINDATGSTSVPGDGGDPNARGSFKSPQFHYLDTPKPGTAQPRMDVSTGGGELVTKDPNVASAHLASIQQALQEGGLTPEHEAVLTAQRDDVRQQLNDYYQHQKVTGAYKPNFPTIDPELAMKSTPDLKSAGKAMQGWGADVYEHANQVTGGEWQRTKTYMEDLQDKLAAEPDLPSRADVRSNLHQQIAEAQNKMDGMLTDPRNGFDQTDIAQARKNFRAGYILERAHSAIQPLYTMEEQAHGGVGLYRGFNGNQLGRRFQAFLDAPENTGARDIIGRDRVNTLQRMFEANDTQASRRRFTRTLMDVAAYVGGPIIGHSVGGVAGGFAGEGAAIGARHVMHQMVVNPRIAKNVLFAIESGARPENFAPQIARMIRDSSGFASSQAAQHTDKEEPQQ